MKNASYTELHCRGVAGQMTMYHTLPAFPKTEISNCAMATGSGRPVKKPQTDLVVLMKFA